MSRAAHNICVAIAPVLTLAIPALAAAEPAGEIPEITQYLPDNTAYVVLLDMRNETWEQLGQYALFQQLQDQGVDFLNAGGLPFLPVDLDYQEDIGSWVGDTAATALMPLELPQVTAIEEHEILIAPIAQPDNFDPFLRRIADVRDAYPDIQNYQTFSIFYWEPQFFEVLDNPLPPIEPLPPLEAPPPVTPLPPPVFDPPVIEPPPPLPEPGDRFEAPPIIETPPPITDPTLEPAEPVETPLPEPMQLLSPSSTELESSKGAIKAVPEEEPEIEPPVVREPDVPGLAIAVFPDFIVAAEHPAAIRSWADQSPETVADSLATNDRFLRTLSHPHYDESFAAFYGSVAEIVKFSLADFPLPNLPIDIPRPADLAPSEIAQLAATQLDSSVEVLLYPTDRGLRLQGRGYYDDNTALQLLTSVVQPAPEAILSNVPGNSYGMLSGHNIAGFWEGIQLSLEASEETSMFLDQSEETLMLTTGLNFDDLFGWMDQGFSVFLFPTEETPINSFLPDVDVGLGLLLQTSDRAAAEYALSQLDVTLEDLFVIVEPTMIDEKPATSWSSFLDFDAEPDSFLGYGWVNDDTLALTTSLGSLSEIFNLEPAQALPNSLRFLWSTEDFPEANQGYGYLNLASVRSLFFRLFPVFPGDLEGAEFQRLAGSVRTASTTVSFGEEYFQLDGLLMLSPTEQPDFE
ncbi:DUF3352 domain-containing protein [Oscillatoria sp. CS-180]|uniref:DUF3352 domain-containing protein n=1 Tax=Oscillatoria sp. CS-180 TaxID=3021720 RepID=UPI0023315B23|nr:DUF3352 domain-containing protein [Oscillatoria sp. CS-180]MDB9525042.1 DUF3352 domain-containing protein [Oscillatoria sp. CS-180]